MYCNIRNKTYALFIALSLLFLQISLASINPHKLLATGFESQGVKSYITAMDMNSDSTATSWSNRQRQRSLSAVGFDYIHRTVTDKIDTDIIPSLFVMAFNRWLLHVGQSFEAMPQADMVALK